MWSIQNPNRVFSRFAPTINNSFSLVAIIPTDKYFTFSEESRTEIESITLNGFSISDFHVQDPNNPANLIDVKVIKYFIV